MSNSGGDGEKQRGEEDQSTDPQDLFDFYGRWLLEFRQTAELLSQRADLSPLERRTIRGMMEVLDRISEQHDLQPREPQVD
jgi:hypothetical protein